MNNIKIQQNRVGKKILRVWIESIDKSNSNINSKPVILLCVFFHVYSNQVR